MNCPLMFLHSYHITHDFVFTICNSLLFFLLGYLQFLINAWVLHSCIKFSDPVFHLILCIFVVLQTDGRAGSCVKIEERIR